MEILNNINAMLIEKIGPLGPLVVLGGIGLLLILLVLPTMLKKKVEPFSKLKAQYAPASATKNPGDALRRGEKNTKLDKFANFLEPQNAVDMSAARMKMLRAGYRGKNSVRTFHFAQFALGIGFLDEALLPRHLAGLVLILSGLIAIDGRLVTWIRR